LDFGVQVALAGLNNKYTSAATTGTDSGSTKAWPLRRAPGASFRGNACRSTAWRVRSLATSRKIS
jgi:hypothetical protein